jgi:hypothetical protein
LLRKQGKAAGVGDAGEGTQAADVWDRGEARPGVSSGVRERAKRREAGWRWGADTRARAARFEPKPKFKRDQIDFEFL